jgi:spore coat polysaccharide biosynthesis protein SpsF
MVENLRTVAILQARMGSSRLPGKVLLDIAGQPMLARVVNRVRRARLLDGMVVATTKDASDDPLAAYCLEHDIACMRGSQFDVLDRFHRAASQQKADIVVRITADCPVIDPLLIDEALMDFKDSRVDFAANRLPPPYARTYPIGLDIEICTFKALSRAWQEASQPYQREHVMPYLYEEVQLEVKTPTRSIGISRNGFKVLQLNHVPDYGSLRWTVDTAADLEFIRAVHARFEGRDDFSWLEMLALVQSNPDLPHLNDEVSAKSLHEVDERGNS